MSQNPRMKFILGGVLMLAAVIYLIISSTQASAQYFMTIDELKEKQTEALGRELRVSGAIIGESIDYDAQNLVLKFTVAHVPGDNAQIEREGGLSKVLYDAVNDPTRARIDVVFNGVKPDLMRDEAQAIMTGKLGEDGIFYAEELLLKCPTKYEEAVPEQAEG
jgi:cytochrome c-type biogenesis protein CcmE